MKFFLIPLEVFEDIWDNIGDNIKASLESENSDLRKVCYRKCQQNFFYCHLKS